MKKLICLMLILSASILKAEEFKMMPKFHVGIMVDNKYYFGDNANSGNYETTDRFQIRKAAIGITGDLKNDFSYEMEIGISTCIGTTDQVKLMEAGISWSGLDFLTLSLQKGHVNRGFASLVECSTRMVMEKSEFIKSFGTCHPIGFIAEGHFEFGKNMAIEPHLAIANGINETLDDEKDFILGTIFRTPIEGLSLIGTYNLFEKKYFDQNFEEYAKEGYRIFTGIDYQAHNISFTGEYYTGEGFERDDQVMNAYYLQAGYTFITNLEILKSVQPYGKYDYWDRDADSDEDAEFTNLEAGINFNLNSYARFRLAYNKELSKPESQPEKPDNIVIRLQADF